MKAIYNEKVIAESNDTVFLENNHYSRLNRLTNPIFQSQIKKLVVPGKELHLTIPLRSTEKKMSMQLGIMQILLKKQVLLKIELLFGKAFKSQNKTMLLKAKRDSI